MNTKPWAAMIAGVVGLTVGYPVLAAEGPFKRGSWELALISDFDSGFRPSIQYYLIDDLAVSAAASYVRQEGDITEQRYGVGLEFDLPTGAIVPFLGTTFEWIATKGFVADPLFGCCALVESDGPAWALTGGIKVMVGARGSVNLRGSYTLSDVNSQNINGYSGDLGFSLFF